MIAREKRVSYVLVMVLTALGRSLCLAAEPSEAPAGGAPRLAAVRVEAPPVVDGALDDACWREASHITGFWREQVDAPALEPTEAWICQDSEAVYVAFRCHDSRPSEIRASQRKRQGSLHHDDAVVVSLDVENLGHSSYQFEVNPLGTQADEVPGGTSEKIEWKGDWRAAARIDEQGWTAEVAIPLSILRYPDGQDCFRISLERRLARAEDEAVWPPGFARRHDRDECARWTGVATPRVGFRYVAMPYLLSVASEQEEQRETLTGGLDVKGTFPNGVVALATYKPDFRNLEDVVETIDFTFVERYLPEYRPFFQEGSGYMPVSGDEWDVGPVGLLYTRRIEELDYGLKSFGTLGRHRFGILDAYRRGGENHLAWNYARLFGTEGSLSFAGVDRRVPGDPDNLAYNLGTHWHFPFTGGSRSFSGDWYRCRTEGEGGDAEAMTLNAGVWRDQGLGWWLDYSAVNPEFRADDGYVPEPGLRRGNLGLNHRRYYDEGPVLDREWYGGFDAGESEGGRRRGMWLSHDVAWRSGWGASAGISRGERDGFDVTGDSAHLSWNRQDMYRHGDIGFTWGERYGERYRYQSLSQGFRPTDRWSAQVSAEQSFSPDLDDEGNVVPAERSRQLVLTTSYEIGPERTVSARLVRGDAGTNVYAAYRQRVRRGMDVLIVVGDPNAEGTVARVAVKAMWCL